MTNIAGNNSSNGKRTSTRSPPGQKSANALAVQRFRDRRKQQIEQLRTENDELNAQVEQLKREMQKTLESAPGSTTPTHLAQIEVDNYLLKRENEHLRSLAHRCVLTHQGDLVQLEAMQNALPPTSMPLPPVATHQQHFQTLTPTQSQQPVSQQQVPVPALNTARPYGNFSKVDLSSMHSTSSREMKLKLGEQHQQRHTPVSPSNTSQHSGSSCSTAPTPPASAAFPFLSSTLNVTHNHSIDVPLDPGSPKPPTPFSTPAPIQDHSKQSGSGPYSSYVSQDWTYLLNATIDPQPTTKPPTSSSWASIVPLSCA